MKPECCLLVCGLRKSPTLVAEGQNGTGRNACNLPNVAAASRGGISHQQRAVIPREGRDAVRTALVAGCDEKDGECEQSSSGCAHDFGIEHVGRIRGEPHPIEAEACCCPDDRPDIGRVLERFPVESEHTRLPENLLLIPAGLPHDGENPDGRPYIRNLVEHLLPTNIGWRRSLLERTSESRLRLIQTVRSHDNCFYRTCLRPEQLVDRFHAFNHESLRSVPRFLVPE